MSRLPLVVRGALVVQVAQAHLGTLTAVPVTQAGLVVATGMVAVEGLVAVVLVVLPERVLQAR